MKKVLGLFVVLAVFCFMVLGAMPEAAAAVNKVVPANQVTLAWDAVTMDADGVPIPAELQVRYHLYYVSTLDVGKTNPVDVGTTSTLGYVFTFSGYGAFLLGVKSELLLDGVVVSESPISWSDQVDRCLNGETFAVIRINVPAMVGGMHLQQ